jgi:hypothetical protein
VRTRTIGGAGVNLKRPVAAAAHPGRDFRRTTGKTHNPSTVPRDVGDACPGRSKFLRGGIAVENDSIEEVTM